MAAANDVGGDGAPLGGREREPEKGGRRHGESARPGRVRGVADGVQGDERKAASRRWPGHRQRSPPSCFGGRGGRRQGGTPGGLGRTGAGPAGLPGERQVRFLSSLLFLFLFLFIYFVLCCFSLVKY